MEPYSPDGHRERRPYDGVDYRRPDAPAHVRRPAGFGIDDLTWHGSDRTSQRVVELGRRDVPQQISDRDKSITRPLESRDDLRQSFDGSEFPTMQQDDLRGGSVGQ